MKDFFTPKKIARTGFVAALYAATTLAIPILSYGAVQFRLSEVLVLLCYYNPEYCVAMALGCAAANLFSPMWLDIPVGTLATVLAVLPMFKIKKLWIASLLPVISNAVLIGLEIKIVFGAPFGISALSVAAGEFVVVTVIGVTLFRFVLEKNPKFFTLIGARPKNFD